MLNLLPLEFFALDSSSPIQNCSLESPQNYEWDDECETPGVEDKPDRRWVNRRHAASEAVVLDRCLVHDVGEIGEARTVNVHWERDDQGHDPGQGDEQLDGGHLPLGGVLKGVEDRVAPVQADPDETVDTGRAEGDVSGDEHLTRGQASQTHPSSLLKKILVSEL